MVNRANVEFYQFYELIKNEGLSSLLYVTDNGQPAKMGNDLERLMKQARVFMEKIGRMEEWSGESVASLLIVMYFPRKNGHPVKEQSIIKLGGKHEREGTAEV